jgi:hypothetical protein
MRFFKYFLAFQFLLNSCAAQNRGDKTYGTQRITMLFTFSNDTSVHLFMPESKLLYYEDYMIEQVFDRNDTYTNNNLVSVKYDTTYYFINFKNKTCVSYNKVSLDAVKGRSYNLKDKPHGIEFGKVPDSSRKRSRPVFVKDTLMNGVKYKILSAYILPPNDKVEIVYYVDGNFLGKLLFHLNEMDIGDEYKGTVTRIDNYVPSENSWTSARMTVSPGDLSAYQIAVFKSWIAANR